jgi:hypothetical protein
MTLARTDNPAALLQKTILSLMDSGTSSVHSAWQSVLGVAPGTAEFARLHAEVVALFNRVCERLVTLPEEDIRNQYLAYVPTWYGAIVYQRGPWSNQGSIRGPNPGDLADRNIVNHLTGLAATFELEYLTTPSLDDDAIDRLQGSIAEWRKILSDPDFDQKLANEIRADVDHIEFLLSHRQRFGAEPVFKAAQDFVGTAVVAMAKQPKWSKKIGAAMAGIFIFLHGAHGAVDDANGILEGVVKMWTEVSEIMDPQKQIEHKNTPELAAGTGHAHDDNVVDAETVDPEPPDRGPD